MDASGVLVRRKNVRLTLHESDPQNISKRRLHYLSKRRYHCPGPNFAWYFDDRDNIKSYGIYRWIFPVFNLARGCRIKQSTVP